MLRLIWEVRVLAARELSRRPARALALMAGIFVAALSFGMLSSETASSRLQATRTVKRNFRAAYDILVRPKGAAGSFERDHHLVDDTFLSGVFGGVTMAQYREIASLPGVSLAAPVANVGYFLVPVTTFVPFPSFLRRAPGAVYKISTNWSVHNGLARYPGADSYVYYTRRPITITSPGTGIERGSDGRRENVCGQFYAGMFQAITPSSHGVPVISGGARFDPYRRALLPSFYCASPNLRLAQAAKRAGPFADRPFEPPGQLGVEVSFDIPVLVAGIDPRAEAQLVGLRGAMASGSYLREGAGLSHPEPPQGYSPGGPRIRTYPVIASIDTFLDQEAALTVRRVYPHAPHGLLSLLGSSSAYSALTSAREGPILTRLSGSPTNAWRDFLANSSRYHSMDLGSAYWRVGATTKRVRSGVVEPVPVVNEPRVWVDSSPTSEVIGASLAPPGSDDVWYRHIRVFGSSGNEHLVDGQPTDVTPVAQLTGTFNPAKLRGFSPLSKVPLQTFYPPVATAGDHQAQRLLGKTALGPTTNLGGYLSQPPLLLTTIQGAIALDNGDGDSYRERNTTSNGAPARGYTRVEAFEGASPSAPISAVQVRVKGVSGPDPLSIARIKLVAEEIAGRTGLTVDITAGSSPTSVEVRLQPGKFGTPALLLRQGWVKEDVDATIVQALDSKDLALFFLVATACALFVVAAALATVRQRRREIAILSTIGWTQRAIFGLVLSETGFVGLAAGALALLVDVALADLGALQIPVVRLALIVPLSVAIAVGAGAVPAARASRIPPLEALRPPTLAAARRWRVRTIRGLGMANVGRAPVRSLLAAAVLALAVAALTLIIGFDVAFNGAVAGTLLGDTVSIDLRGVDVAATMLVLLVGVGSVLDVLLISLRERGREISTLRACGWSERDVACMALTEGLALGLTGTLIGSGAGVVLIALLGGSAWATLETAVAAVAGGCALTVLTLVLPIAGLVRKPAVAGFEPDWI